MKNIIDVFNSALAELRTTLIERDRIIAELDRTIADMRHEIASLVERISQLNNNIANRDRTIAGLRAQADAPTATSKVFFYDGKPDASGEYLVILCGKNGSEELPGWYFMVEDEPYGPWATQAIAQVEAAGIGEESNEKT